MPIVPTNIPEDSSSHFGFALPKIDISKITIDTGPDPDDSAHYYSANRNAAPGGQNLGSEVHYMGKNSRIKQVFVQDPHITMGIPPDEMIDKSDPGPTNLHVSINLSMKLSIPKQGDIVSSFLFNDNFVKYFKFFVIQNTGPNAEGTYLETMFQKEKDALSYTAPPDEIVATLNYIENSMNSVNVRSFTGTELLQESGFISQSGGKVLANKLLRRLNKKVDANGNTIVDVPYTIGPSSAKSSFIVDGTEPEHLSYFLIATVDVEAIKDDFGDLDDVKVEDFPMTVSPVLVISNNKVAGNIKVFRYAPYSRAAKVGAEEDVTGPDPSSLDGHLYDGPVHKHPGGVYMTGEYHTHKSRRLDIEILDSAKAGFIQDFRIAPKEMKAPNQSHMNYQKVHDIGKPANLKHLTNDTIATRADTDMTSCFSNLFSSRDLSWNWTSAESTHKEYIKFFFSINFLELLLQNTNVPVRPMFEYMGTAGAPAEMATFVNDIFAESQILSLKLWRKRVELESGINDTGLAYKSVKDYDKNSVPVLVANYIQTEGQSAPDTKQSGDIRQVNKFVSHSGGAEIAKLHNAPFMLHFSGHEETKPSHYEIQTLSKQQSEGLIRGFEHLAGDWSYHVELEAVDAMAIWLSNLHNEFLENLLMPLEEYYYLATSQRSNGRPYFNITTGRFHPDLLINAGPTAGLPMNKLQQLIHEVTTNKKVDCILSKYIAFITLFEREDPGKTNNTNYYKDATEKYNKLLFPDAGATPTSIKALLDHTYTSIKNLESFLEVYVGGTIKKEPVNDSSGILPVRNKITANKTFKIKYKFDGEEDIVNFDLVPRVGCDYLDMGPPKPGKLVAGFQSLGGSATQGLEENLPQTITTRPVGLVEISTTDFTRRVGKERAKYFDSSKNHAVAWVKDNSAPMKVNQAFLPIPQFQSFLTVSTIHFQTEGGPSHIWNSGITTNTEDYYFPWFPNTPALDWKFYNNLFMKAVRFNMGLATGQNPYTINDNKNFTPKLSPEKQIARNELIDVLSAGVNCTVENIGAFSKPPPRTPKCPKEQEKINNAVTELTATEQKIQADAKVWEIYKGTKMSNIVLPKFSYDDTNPTPELSQLLNYFMNYLRSNFFGNVNEKDYDLNNVSTLAGANIEELPNQIKALVTLMTDRGTFSRLVNELGFDPPDLGAVPDLDSSLPWIGRLSELTDLYEITDMSKKKFRQALDRILFPFYYFYFFNISEVQILSHYADTGDKIQMKQPVFVRMTPTHRGLVNGIQGTSVCRQVKYNNSVLNIFNYEEIDLPTYNEHFLLKAGA